jgi:hypothetical protein
VTEVGEAPVFDVLESHSELEAAKAEQRVVRIELQILQNNLQ